jgi:hypothetical protein
MHGVKPKLESQERRDFQRPDELARLDFKWIMLLSGVLICTMLYAAIAPQAALRSSFGETLEGPVAEVVVRNWGALIGIVGGMLIYGAFRPASRRLILTIAGLGKLVFIGLVLAQGDRFLSHQAATAVWVDLVMVALFSAHLIAAPRDPSRGPHAPR